MLEAKGKGHKRDNSLPEPQDLTGAFEGSAIWRREVKGISAPPVYTPASVGSGAPVLASVPIFPLVVLSPTCSKPALPFGSVVLLLVLALRRVFLSRRPRGAVNGGTRHNDKRLGKRHPAKRMTCCKRFKNGTRNGHKTSGFLVRANGWKIARRTITFPQ